MNINGPRIFDMQKDCSYNKYLRIKQLQQLQLLFMINQWILTGQVYTLYLLSHQVQRTACRMPKQMQSPATKQEMLSSEKIG